MGAKARNLRRGRPTGLAAALPWIIAGGAGVGLAVVLLGGPSAPVVHPEPRADAADAAAGVMPPSFFAGNPRVMQAYQAAREVPETLDGLYCYCQCNEHLGHRSLLICFHSQHGAGCDVCIDEAVQAREMVRQNRSLADIRTAIDLAFAR
jgi:hypothetical protein